MTVRSRFPGKNCNNFELIAIAILSLFALTSLSFAERLKTADTGGVQITRIGLTAALPIGTVGISYGGSLKPIGGQAPYQFVVVKGQLPTGLSLDPHTGAVTGKPSVAGTYSFTVRATDLPDADRGEGNFSMSIAKATPSVSVTVSPTSTNLASAGKQQFTAAVANASNTSVTWTASTGSISTSGLFTAPAVSTSTTATIRATSVADPTKSASATVTVQGQTTAVSVALSPSSTSVNSAATQQFTATVSGTSNTAVTWSSTAGTVSSSGVFTAPTVTSNSTATVKATSAADPTKSASATVSILAQTTTPPPPPPPPPSTGADNRYCQPGDVANFGASHDGPAQLPTHCIHTALSSTPSPGKTILVPSGGNVAVALNSAACGDTIQLQAGGTFSPFTLPAKNCDSKHWITIRTSAPDSALPAEGSRLTPCYAGVASLPARPAYSCSSPKNVLATILSTNSFLMKDSAGSDYYRFIGIEFTRTVGSGPVYRLFQLSTGDHIIFDRVWMHGTARDETIRGISLGGSTNIAVVDSYLNDFHCIAMTGTCTDAQTIHGGVGTIPGGPYKIVNNFLEASTENILFGGGPGTVTPADIEVRRNHFFKPPMWRQGDPTYFGTRFVVKNLFELKNATRVLLEANLLENTWGGFSQFGYGILLTAKSQQGTCPACQVTDVTIRYNWLSHVGAGMQIANGLSSGSAAMAGGRFSIHDVVIDDVNGAKYAGNGVLFQISEAAPVLNNVSISHVTGMTDPAHTLLMVGAPTNSAMPNFTFTNNLVVAGKYAVTSNAAGMCTVPGQPTTTLNNCFVPYYFKGNAILGYVPTLIANYAWPAGNYSPNTVSTANMVNYNNGVGGNYALLSTSPYKNAGTDGKDLGADLNALNAALAGVQ